jgi:hypothetical protein
MPGALHGWRTPLFVGADKPLMQPQVTAQDKPCGAICR